MPRVQNRCALGPVQRLKSQRPHKKRECKNTHRPLGKHICRQSPAFDLHGSACILHDCRWMHVGGPTATTCSAGALAVPTRPSLAKAAVRKPGRSTKGRTVPPCGSKRTLSHAPLSKYEADALCCLEHAAMEAHRPKPKRRIASKQVRTRGTQDETQ